TLCAWQEEWNDLDLAARSRLMARQGVRYPTLADLQVADPRTHAPVPRDARTLGEVMLRGNTIMKGYLKNQRDERRVSRGLVSHGRPRRVARRRLHRGEGSLEGHHHLGRREHLV